MKRQWLKIPMLVACTLALGLVYACGEEETTTPNTSKDGGLPPGPDAGGVPGQDAGPNQPGTDAGPQTKPDGGGVVLNELQNVTLKDIRTNIDTYVDQTTRKPKAIVNVVGATVISDYPHSDGNHSIYIQQGTGANRGGLLVFYKPGTTTPPAVGSTVDVRGCANVYWSVLQLQYCGDASNTQVAFSNVVAGSVPGLDASDKFAPTELAGSVSTHDDHLGMRVEATGALTVESAQAPECQGSNGSYFCLKMSSGVYVKTAFVHKCDASLLTGPYTNLVGVLDWYQSGENKFRTIVPLSCDALSNAKK